MLAFTAGFILGGLFIMGMIELRTYLKRKSDLACGCHPSWEIHYQKKAEREAALDDDWDEDEDFTCGCHESWGAHEAYMIAGTTAVPRVGDNQ